MSTRSVSMSTKIKLDPNRPKFKVKPRPKEVVVGGPTESVRFIPCAVRNVREGSLGRELTLLLFIAGRQLPTRRVSVSKTALRRSLHGWVSLFLWSFLDNSGLISILILNRYFVGSPDLAMNVVKAAEKGVTKVTGLSSDPIGDRRERKRKAALAKLSAMDTYGVTPEPTAAVERVEGETKQDAPKA